MLDPTSLGIFLIATLALNITPGPDMLYVLARGIGQGRLAGVVSALGVGGGILVHTFALALGLSALLVSVPAAYDVVRYGGAAYLLYLGIKTFISKTEAMSATQLKKDSLWRIFAQGVVTNVLNPKVALFFLAFLPQFVDERRGPAVWQFILLGLIFNISGTLVNILVALLSGYIGGRLKAHRRVWRFQRWLTGGIFVALAARLALPEQR